MTQRELNRSVAAATGESVGTISEMGFVPLTAAPYEAEHRRRPLVVDWDEVDAQRDVLHPVG